MSHGGGGRPRTAPERPDRSTRAGASTVNEDSNGGGNDDASDSGAHSGAASPGRNSSGPVDGGAWGAGTSDASGPPPPLPIAAARHGRGR
jgi:hypothetical protein